MDEIIRLENIWKNYKLGSSNLAILKGINLIIKKGSFCAIMGPSGSGKSTLLHILGALDVPSEGKLFFDGEDISSFSEDQLAKVRSKKIGFVFQQFNLMPNFTAMENVMMPMVFQRIPESARFEKAKRLLVSLGLEKRLFHKPNELSGGERQRIAIARSLSNDPEMIVADEPTGNLDSSTGKKIMAVLEGLHKEHKKTLLIVTHDPEIAAHAQRVINIKDGEIA